MPEGMKENDKFPNPIITPTTKADQGHDEGDVRARGAGLLTVTPGMAVLSAERPPPQPLGVAAVIVNGGVQLRLLAWRQASSNVNQRKSFDLNHFDVYSETLKRDRFIVKFIDRHMPLTRSMFLKA